MPQKQITGQKPLGSICDENLFFGLYPEFEDKTPTTGGLQAKMSQPSENLECICDEDLLLVFTANLMAKSAQKTALVPLTKHVPTKQELCPPKKQHNRRHWSAIAMKNRFLLSSSPNMFLCLPKNVLCPAKIFCKILLDF